MRRSASNVEYRTLFHEDTSNMRIWPKKVDEPDMGTYDSGNAIKFVKVKNPKWSVCKSK